jgi:hypothetical protein
LSELAVDACGRTTDTSSSLPGVAANATDGCPRREPRVCDVCYSFSQFKYRLESLWAAIAKKCAFFCFGIFGALDSACVRPSVSRRKNKAKYGEECYS